METLVVYNPECTFIDGAYRQTVSKEIFYRTNKEWVSLSPQESICSGGWWIYDTDKSMFHFTISRA